MAKTPKKIFRSPGILDGDDKKCDSKQGRLFGSVAKIPIAYTFSVLVEMDFVDYGDYAALLHIQDTLSRFSVVVFMGGKTNEVGTSEMPRGEVISHWLAVFGGACNYRGGRRRGI